MQFTISTLALLSSLAAAAPTHDARGTGIGTTFNLIFKGLGTAPKPVAALNSGTWFVASRNLRAEMVSDGTQANLFYRYNSPDTDSRIATADTMIKITPGGTATVSSGKPVELVNNNGTQHVYIMENASGVPTLWYDGGRFQACADGQGIFLSYIAVGQRRLVDCAPVEVAAVCSSGGVGSPLTGQLGKPLVVLCQSG
ncbi:hypothetical protein BDV95DRAFT_316424 [Massariosphaeria phaeospora]|uniref:Uncharacterized protein n=1 Tax=Massariosphaeria phaeospora TaxID=100035 RepID=A0A7C8IKZ0_9PLEO|nr:hypothetical protein BDV95DRAFT_316424 [Massariosphaeria phaeospora]